MRNADSKLLKAAGEGLQKEVKNTLKGGASIEARDEVSTGSFH